MKDTIIIDENFRGLIKKEGYYEYPEELCYDANVEIKVDLHCLKSIEINGSLTAFGSIESNGCIEIDRFLSAEGDIKADSYIVAEWLGASGSISAGMIMVDEFIQANEFLECDSINAGWSVYAGKWIDAQSDIKAGGYVIAREFIKAFAITSGEFVKAGKSIETKSSITAKQYIRAGTHIKAGGRIYAGSYISAYKSIITEGYIKADDWIRAPHIETEEFVYSYNYDIDCKRLKTKTMPYFRQYYMLLPVFTDEQKAVIRNKCWKEIKRELCKDKERIINWEGWHPIIKAQLEMFLGVKKEVNLQAAINNS